MIKNKSLWIGGTMFVFLMAVMIVGPYLPFIDSSLEREKVRINDNGIQTPPYPPSEQSIIGSDADGRDLLSLLVMGTKDTLFLVFVITIFRYVLAIPLAFLAAKKSGPAHWILSGWNQLFSGLPALFAAILLMNIPYLTFSENRMAWVICIIAIIEVGRVAYIFQQQAHAVSKELFIEAAITVGNSPIALYFRHYLPVLIPRMIPSFFIDLGRVMLLIGQLGLFSIFINQKWFQLTFGSGELRNAGHNWATLLGDARGDILQAFWIPFFPALAVTFTIIAFNLMGEGLRQHFDSKTSAVSKFGNLFNQLKAIYSFKGNSIKDSKDI
jgi:peptide/nickel transport system permease protein